MDERLTPFCISWPKAATSIFVSGSFNNFMFTHIKPETGFIVIWTKPGRIHYHFLVDGKLLVNQDEAFENAFDGEYNYADVKPLPEELGDLAMLTPLEIETLDSELFNSDFKLTCEELTATSEEEAFEESSHNRPIPSSPLPFCKEVPSLHGVVTDQRGVRHVLSCMSGLVPRRFRASIVVKKCKARVPKVISIV
jgi:hypothetical protein